MTRWTKTAEERFFDKIEIDSESGCWLWTACLVKGYGRFQDQGKTTDAHKWAYNHFVGPTPLGLVLDHIVCDNRACANPNHLKPVTSGANTLRGIGIPAANKRKSHCVHGHPFDDANTYVQTKPDGTHRYCKRCRADCEQRRRDRLKCAGV